MKKNMTLLLVTFLFLLIASNAALANTILGDTVEIQFLFPNSIARFGLSATGVVSASGVSLNLFDNQLVTVFADHVDMVGIRPSGSFFLSAPFNGVSVQDLTNASPFTDFSVDSASNISGFDISRVSMSGGLLFINYESLSTPFQSLARVDFNVIPEPSSLALLGSGLVAIAAKFRRKLRS